MARLYSPIAEECSSHERGELRKHELTEIQGRRELIEDEYDDDVFDDIDDDDEGSTVPCPFCRREIPEDTPRCPYCENYISAEDRAALPTSKPWWIILGAVLGLIAAYHWFFP